MARSHYHFQCDAFMERRSIRQRLCLRTSHFARTRADGTFREMLDLSLSEGTFGLDFCTSFFGDDFFSRLSGRET